jgi:coenzyme F420-0:L-glutamate ligase/coenzyme F420-1:gamma-L-glutamate ligase
MTRVEIIGVRGIPEVKPGDDIAKLICSAAEAQGDPIRDGDVVIVAQKIVSKAEGRILRLSEVQPTEFARTVAAYTRKRPSLAEVILRESKSIVRMAPGHLITETRQGIVCANSGVDRSNVDGGGTVTLLPEDPDRSAKKIRNGIKKLARKTAAVIISDTSGRPLREGHVDIAIGIAGIEPISDLRGQKDLFGYTLRVKQTAVADELAAAGELVIGQAQEAIPVAIIRGFKFRPSDRAKASKLIRRREKDLFI